MYQRVTLVLVAVAGSYLVILPSTSHRNVSFESPNVKLWTGKTLVIIVMVICSKNSAWKTATDD
jgi:hypothetical protein